jgi:hypothetical protein
MQQTDSIRPRKIPCSRLGNIPEKIHFIINGASNKALNFSLDLSEKKQA